MILNDGILVASESSKTVEEIRQILQRIIEQYYESQTGPDFEKIKLSTEYRVLTERVRLLQLLNPGETGTLNESKCFWINAYNTLAIHGIIHFQIKLTVWERPNFFISTEYNIGGYRFSLYDIAHGIIRGNRKRWRFLFHPFGKNDPRSRFMLEKNDPRMHFTLYAGSRSCPPISVYYPERLDEELDSAARRFMNSNQVIFDKQTRILSCSKIFHWYARDFGAAKSERLAFIARYTDDHETRAILSGESSSVSVKFLPYDWHLNTTE